MSENRAGLPNQGSAVGILMGGEHLTAFGILDTRGGIAIMATLGESRCFLHRVEATDNLLIETTEASDSLNYLKHVCILFSSSSVVCHVCHSNIIIVKSQGVS